MIKKLSNMQIMRLAGSAVLVVFAFLLTMEGVKHGRWGLAVIAGLSVHWLIPWHYFKKFENDTMYQKRDAWHLWVGLAILALAAVLYVVFPS